MVDEGTHTRENHASIALPRAMQLHPRVEALSLASHHHCVDHSNG